MAVLTEGAIKALMRGVASALRPEFARIDRRAASTDDLLADLDRRLANLETDRSSKALVQRAFMPLTVRAVPGGAERVITGTASTPTPDRAGDVVEPLGAQFKTPFPLLWQHRHAEPVGSVEFAKATPAGIRFRARIARVDEPGRLKDRVDEAWHCIQHNLVTAVSIGFRPRESKPLADGGLRFTAYEIIELSLVTIPANPDARIEEST